jgi:hypothetical protein
MMRGLIVPPRENWTAKAMNQGEPMTFVHRGTGSALQFSIAQYRPGNLPPVETEKLVGICRRVGQLPKGREIGSRTGDCRFGVFGTITVEGDAPRGEPVHLQVWVLSDGQAFILVTHTCDVPPEAQETAEVTEMVLATMLG